MKVNFYLRNEEEEASSIQIVVTGNGRRYRKQTGLSVRTDRWKKPKNGIQTSTDPKVAEKLKEIRLNLEARLSDMSSPEEIEEALDEVLQGKRPGEASRKSGRKKEGEARKKKAGDGKRKKEGVSFWEYFKAYADRERPHVKNYQTMYRKTLEMMGDGDDWDDIDGAWYFRLVEEMQRREYSINYQGTFIKVIKSMMNEALTLKLHTSTDFRHFKKVQETSDSIYLTQEEVDAIWNIGLKLSEERKARDLFIIGIYTAARFSDYSRLSLRNIHDGLIRFVQRKTAGAVVIPASPRVLEVLERNGGRAPDISQQKLNENIKRVCRKAGMTEEVLVTRSKGARHITRGVPKCDLVTSHTARRTGATLLYMSGVPLKQCMMITGHTTEANFMRYIRVQKEENAELLMSNPFFTRK